MRIAKGDVFPLKSLISATMKPTSLIPPVIALAIAGTWLGNQHKSLSTLEQASVVLQKAIAARTATTAGDAPPGKPASPAKASKDQEPINWKKIAGDMRTRIRIQQRVEAMTQEELANALEEIAALDLPKESRAMLEEMLILQLLPKDPGFALTQCFDRLQNKSGHIIFSLAHAMNKWAQNDPVAAVAWFDRQIAAGKFDSNSLDGRSHRRLLFEGSLIKVLFGSDPAAAGRRLGALPEDQRTEALNTFFRVPIKEEDQFAFAKLVRDQLPKEDQTEIFGYLAGNLIENDDYSRVNAYFDRIQVTPAERTACVGQAAESRIEKIFRDSGKNPTRADLDSMREWVTAEAPGTTDTVTGKILANASSGGREMEFSEAADLAVQYHEASGNDDVLSSFLDGRLARQNKEQARVLAGKISDEKRREEILTKLK